MSSRGGLLRLVLFFALLVHALAISLFMENGNDSARNSHFSKHCTAYNQPLYESTPVFLQDSVKSQLTCQLQGIGCASVRSAWKTCLSDFLNSHLDPLLLAGPFIRNELFNPFK